MGIEPTKPLLAQSFIGFEDRGRHQSGTHFRARYHTALGERQGMARTVAWQTKTDEKGCWLSASLWFRL